MQTPDPQFELQRLREEMEQYRSRAHYMPTEEVQRFVTVSEAIKQSSNVTSVSTFLRLHTIFQMVLLSLGMIARVNPWYIAWTMLAATLAHASYMWWLSSLWETRARKADADFAKWYESQGSQ
jgi:hypothetical protein